MLATDLLLLALDDERGTVHSQAAIGLDFGLAGAVTMELGLLGAIRLDNGAVVATGATTCDEILDAALTQVAQNPGKKLSYWIPPLPRTLGGLRARLLERLVSQGTLERRDKRVLLLFHYHIYPEKDTRVEHDIRAGLDEVLLHDAQPDARTTCLIHLMVASHVADAIYPKEVRAAVHQRIDQLNDIEKAGVNAVAGAIAQAQAAAVSAAMAGAIAAATVSATSAACAASASACH